jgi:quercetin dioxygenase-like cupin family protein
MHVYEPRNAARDARVVTAARPATEVLHDSADARLVVFRFSPGQEVPLHRSMSTVTFTVLEGTGVLSGADGERACGAGDVVVYAPDELHGMRASDAELLVLVMITPRPGSRGWTGR